MKVSDILVTVVIIRLKQRAVSLSIKNLFMKVSDILVIVVIIKPQQQAI